MKRWLAVIALVALSAVQPVCANNLLIVGDSISAAFGLDTEQGWVQLLKNRLKEQGYSHQVHNASVSGDTTSGGLARLPKLLAEHQPKVVIIELGGNDGLRGQPLGQVQQNLSRMTELAQQAGAQVLLLGMQLPPNYGPRYTQGFAALYPKIAAEYEAALVPFFLEGVGGVLGMMQGDGVHPSAQAQPILLENVWTVLKDQL